MGGTLAGSAAVSPGTNSTTLTLSGITGTIVKWQSSTDNFNTVITDIAHTAPQLTVTNLTETTQFRAQIQSGSCAPAFSTPATITITVLPIHLGSVKAIRENGGIKVQWIAYNQQNTMRFEIERSTNGNDFTKIYTIASTGTEGDIAYEWLDINPAQGRNYYRIKEVYISGSGEYSTVVSAVIENDKPSISVYPNPVEHRNLNLQIRNMSAGRYCVSYINYTGQVIHQEILTYSGGYRNHTMTVPAVIGHGLYRLIITNADETISTGYSIIIQ